MKILAKNLVNFVNAMVIDEYPVIGYLNKLGAAEQADAVRLLAVFLVALGNQKNCDARNKASVMFGVRTKDTSELFLGTCTKEEKEFGETLMQSHRTLQQSALRFLLSVFGQMKVEDDIVQDYLNNIESEASNTSFPLI